MKTILGASDGGVRESAPDFSAEPDLDHRIRTARLIELFEEEEEEEEEEEADEDEEVECACRRVAVDEDDARDCPVHGPRSAAAVRELEREADAMAAYYGSMEAF